MPRWAGQAALPIRLLIGWFVLAVLGFVIHGLVWLAIIGIVLFLATGAFGWVRRGSSV